MTFCAEEKRVMTFFIDTDFLHIPGKCVAEFIFRVVRNVFHYRCPHTLFFAYLLAMGTKGQKSTQSAYPIFFKRSYAPTRRLEQLDGHGGGDIAQSSEPAPLVQG